MLFYVYKKNNFSTYYPNLTHLFMRNYRYIIEEEQKIDMLFLFFL